MAAKLTNDIVLMLATGLGVGYSPLAPGTVGSLWGVALVWGMQSAGLEAFGWAAVATLVIAAGIPLCARASDLMGRRDPGSVVWDEIAAFPVVFAAADVTPMTAVIGFVLFRAFDIVKPWPIRRFEQLPGGWGVMADDLVAGIYAGACLWIVTQVLPGS